MRAQKKKTGHPWPAGCVEFSELAHSSLGKKEKKELSQFAHDSHAGPPGARTLTQKRKEKKEKNACPSLADLELSWPDTTVFFLFLVRRVRTYFAACLQTHICSSIWTTHAYICRKYMWGISVV
jgi:hypothetical protein